MNSMNSPTLQTEVTYQTTMTASHLKVNSLYTRVNRNDESMCYSNHTVFELL